MCLHLTSIEADLHFPYNTYLNIFINEYNTELSMAADRVLKTAHFIWIICSWDLGFLIV